MASGFNLAEDVYSRVENRLCRVRVLTLGHDPADRKEEGDAKRNDHSREHHRDDEPKNMTGCRRCVLPSLKGSEVYSRRYDHPYADLISHLIGVMVDKIASYTEAYRE